MSSDTDDESGKESEKEFAYVYLVKLGGLTYKWGDYISFLLKVFFEDAFSNILKYCIG